MVPQQWFTKRWQKSFNVIYSCVVIMLSLVNGILSHRKIEILSLISWSPSHTSLYVQSQDDGDDSDGNESRENGGSFHVDPEAVGNIVKDKDIDSLRQLGGIQGITAKLETDAERGIKGDAGDLNRRQEVFGSNDYRKPPAISIFNFVWEALKERMVLISLVCSALTLGFGIKVDGLKKGWDDGASGIAQAFVDVGVIAYSNWCLSKIFLKLFHKGIDINVDIVRGSRRQQVSISNIVVGDVAFLKTGDQVPADGLFLSGHSIRVDESSITGESDHVNINDDENPFLLSGSKVIEGHGTMPVTSVGMNAMWGEMMSSISRESNKKTPLQARLNKLMSCIEKAALAVSFLVVIVLSLRYFIIGNTRDKNRNQEVFSSISNIIVAAATIVQVAIPGSLTLAMTRTLAFSSKRMMADKGMVRKILACETMGSATIICTDKTGTLTLNEMEVTKFWVGEVVLEDISIIAPKILELLHPGVGLNTSVSVSQDHSDSSPAFYGSPTEKAILSWAVTELKMNMKDLKQSYATLPLENFNSERKRSGVKIIKKSDKSTHVHWKGAAEMILAVCSNCYESDGTTKPINEQTRMKLEQIIEGMAAQGLRCIAFAHKQITGENVVNDDNEGEVENIEDGLTLLALVGMKDPCRPGVRDAVEACKRAGVNIKMITGDNVFTAVAIAVDCGILSADKDRKEAVVEGREFGNYSKEERMEVAERVCVMARSSPLHKLQMVECLKQKGHIVAVTGDGINDASALKEADVGLSMGIQGTQVAKKSSDIVILDDDFSSIVSVLSWGRCIYKNFQKVIQFRLTAHLVALLINFVGVVSTGVVTITPTQLLWVNLLIMETLGRQALSRKRSIKMLRDEEPIGRTEPLITNRMWRNIITQALYQAAVILTLHFKGRSIFGVNESIKKTLVFSTLVLCQVFNFINARELEKRNVFKGIHKDRLFVVVVLMTIIIQVVMVELLPGTEQLSLGQWGVCIGIAAMSLPIASAVKCIQLPDKPFLSLFSIKSHKS
eukprot:TRINITY_DN5410_c0_g2_i2.p1 TRINITY_DN5410_c0_g2~~TRINITY_DN5410_c0_g2_i2.p1  ORF type:complete len:1010 (+),score=182.46 TRINITY_DN5410_c0_g2_i2:245-3274(+)